MGDSKFKFLGFAFLICVIAVALLVFIKQLSPKIVPLTAQKATAMPKPKQVRDLNIVLRQIGGSGEEGQVQLTTSDGGKTAIEIKMTNTNTATTSAQPVYIRSGSCKEPGEIVTTLERLKQGFSTTILTESIDELLKKGSLIITVHKPAKETYAITSCAELQKS